MSKKVFGLLGLLVMSASVSAYCPEVKRVDVIRTEGDNLRTIQNTVRASRDLVPFLNSTLDREVISFGESDGERMGRADLVSEVSRCIPSLKIDMRDNPTGDLSRQARRQMYPRLEDGTIDETINGVVFKQFVEEVLPNNRRSVVLSFEDGQILKGETEKHKVSLKDGKISINLDTSFYSYVKVGEMMRPSGTVEHVYAVDGVNRVPQNSVEVDMKLVDGKIVIDGFDNSSLMNDDQLTVKLTLKRVKLFSNSTEFEKTIQIKPGESFSVPTGFSPERKKKYYVKYELLRRGELFSSRASGDRRSERRKF